MASYTVTPVAAFVAGNRKVKIVNLAASGNYTAAGDSVTASSLGLRRIESFVINGAATDGTLQYGVQPVFASNSASVSVKLFETGTGGAGSAEKGSGESLTGVSFRATVMGV